MPQIKSAKKALRQSRKNRKINLQKKADFRNAVKEIKKYLADKKTGEAEKLLPQAYKAIDKAAKTGVIKKNTASRKKSRLVSMIRRAAA